MLTEMLLFVLFLERVTFVQLSNCTCELSYSEWSKWSKCDDLCSGTQTRRRYRQSINFSKHKNTNCTLEPLVEIEKCNTDCKEHFLLELFICLFNSFMSNRSVSMLAWNIGKKL